jgi:GAF domain-containing protein
VNKEALYQRIEKQLAKLLAKSADPVARMATINALLYHKIGYFFWCGFYRLIDGELVVGPYQGPLACMKLARDKGVCRAALNAKKTLIVPDVEKFPGHIPCDARSKSEIVVPLFDQKGEVWAVLDVDSDKPGSFDEDDARGLEAIVKLV